jgi:hypothetical protein
MMTLLTLMMMIMTMIEAQAQAQVGHTAQSSLTMTKRT